MSIPEARRRYREAVEVMSQPDPELLIHLNRKGVGLPWYLEIGNPVSSIHRGNIRKTRLW
jgi:hypothetical protein